jgi:ABC-2 type transport system permease protein/sodium transport system permease protein
MSSPPSDSAWRPARLGRLIRKELSEILRDRRTIVTLLLMPLILYPLLGLAFMQVFASSAQALEAPTYRLAFVDEEQARIMMTETKNPREDGWLVRGRKRLLATGQLVDRSGDTQARLQTLPAQQDLLATLHLAGLTDDPAGALRAGAADLVLRRVGKPLFPPFAPKLETDWELHYREDSATSREAFRYVRRLIETADLLFLHDRLRQLGVQQRIDPTRLIPVPVEPEQVRRTSYLSVLVPLVLILMTITGAVYPAIDLTAGERERGTLEILAAAPVSRLSVLVAKYVAVLVVALLTALLNMAPMVAVLFFTGIAQQAFAVTDLVNLALTLLSIFALLILFAAFFSAVLLAITSFARSFKEAQAYLVPLMLVSLTPGVMSLLPGLELNGALPFVPLLNIVLLARDLLEGTATLATAFLVVTVTLVYAALALALAARIFGAEGALFERRVRKTNVA